MNREANTLSDHEYSFALNTVSDSVDGNSPNLQNEPSNILCASFPTGFKVVGVGTDIVEDKTYFLLTHPTTRVSQVGYISGNQGVNSLEDIPEECGCNTTEILNTPLELQTPVATCIYYPIIVDTCNKCLGFDVRYPIKNIEIHNGVLYFSDALSSPRFIDTKNLEQYNIFASTCDGDVTQCEGDDRCDEECEDCTECINCEKMLIFKNSERLCITPQEIIYGGTLKKGSYSFLAAYCDAAGNELSDYFGITQPINIFDTGHIVQLQPDQNAQTNYAIKLLVEHRDVTYGYYKVAVIQNTNLNGENTYYIEGVHPISDSTVVYSTENNEKRTTLLQLLSKKTKWLTSESVVLNNGYLFHHGLTAQPEINLQPVFSLMGAFLRWKSGAANEDLYKDGIADSLYSGFMRNEVYPFGIRVFTDDDYESAVFSLVNRPATLSEVEEITTNEDIQSLTEFSPQCVENERNKRWQLYDTATHIDSCNTVGGTVIVENSTIECISETDYSAGSGVYIANLPITYTNLEEFINQYWSDINNPISIYYNLQLSLAIQAALADITPCENLLPTGCTRGAEIVGDRHIIADVVYIDPPNEEVVERTTKVLADYNISAAPAVCNIYQPGTTAQVDDTSFTSGAAYYRYTPINESCSTAVPLQLTSPQGYYTNYLQGTDILSISDISRTATATPGFFAPNLHKKAIWFKFDFGTDLDKILEITSGTVCGSGSETLGSSRDVRISFYTSCVIGAPSIPSQLVNLDTGALISLTRADFGQDIVYVAIDSRYVSVSPTEYYIDPPCGCFGVLQRPIEYTTSSIAYADVIFNKVTKYEVACNVTIPTPSPCTVIPFEYGKFGYVESTEKYPCNQELYDSSGLVINPTQVSGFSDEFETYFKDGLDGDGNYILKNAKLDNTPIRHYKMPSNATSPFMTPVNVRFNESIIFPLGIYIDNSIINAFLDIAVTNSLITQELRDKITRYEIVRGDRTLNKSIVAKGLLYDVYHNVEENGSEDVSVYHSNYPYNSLGLDQFNFTNSNRNTYINHPFNTNNEGGDKNNRWTFHSPDTHFRTPTLPSEITFEGYQFGKSRGTFREVGDHPKYVILGTDAFHLATILGVAEAALESALIIGQAFLDYVNVFYTQVGVDNGANLQGILIGGAFVASISIAQAIAAGAYKAGKYRYEWLTIFRQNGDKSNNFAYYYTSTGWYNYFTAQSIEGNYLRGISASRYLKQGRYNVVEPDATQIRINNVDRESSVFLSIANDTLLNDPFTSQLVKDSLTLTYSDDYRYYDNVTTNRDNASRRTAYEADVCDSKKEIDSNIASQYVSIGNYSPAQYGDIDDIKWLPTSYCGDLTVDNSACDSTIIFGGDTKISRFSLKRKLPFFTTDAMGLANQTPFAYSLYNNIGNVNKFANFDIDLDSGTGIGNGVLSTIWPDIGSTYNFDCYENHFYIRKPSKFYLYSYGIPQFLVESEINCNYRTAQPTPENWFYPQAGDYVWWTQQKNVPIGRDNTYFYNLGYSMNPQGGGYRILPSTYSAASWANRFKYPNGVIASQQFLNENSFSNPFLNYKPLDFYNFPSSYGKLIALTPIESQQLLARFTNQLTVVNSTNDYIKDRLTEQNYLLGTGIFNNARPVEFNISSTGFLGTQNYCSTKSEYGLYTLDAKRGGIFEIAAGGQKMTEISAFKRGGESSGMRQWFKKHLPFKILKNVQGITDLDCDNAFNGVGISMVFDNLLRRLIITKQDRQLKDSVEATIKYIDREFYTSILNDDLEEVLTKISIDDTTYFENVSWTISYDVLKDSFVSYHSYKPNFYLSYSNYFQSGYNNTTGSLYSHHLLNNTSFQVFNYQLYPWIIDIGSATKYSQKVFTSYNYWMDSRRYKNYNNDYAPARLIGFNKAVVYNQNNNSGDMNLVVAQKNNAYQNTQYPIFNTTSTDILTTENENKWNFNMVFNRVKNDISNNPIWINDSNQILKTLNNSALNYLPTWQDRMRGDWFSIRLTQDYTSQYKMIYRWGQENSNITR